MKSVLESCTSLWDEALGIWRSGGWAMVAIAVISLVMFSVGVSVWLKLRRTGFDSVPERVWRSWLERPAERRGRIGKLLDQVTGSRSLPQMARHFDELRTTEAAPFERDLRLMKVCVGAAPLVGLLGTVTGMLATFAALATGSGGDKTMGLVAGGISEALITTETGLVIALPGLFFQYRLQRKFEAYRAFLAHLETVCTQALHRLESNERSATVVRAARQLVAERLRARLQEGRRTPFRSIPTTTPVEA